MKTHNGGSDVTEKLLFHGTDNKHIDAICRDNFDWRICGTHGTAYGKGEKILSNLVQLKSNLTHGNFC